MLLRSDRGRARRFVEEQLTVRPGLTIEELTGLAITTHAIPSPVAIRSWQTQHAATLRYNQTKNPSRVSNSKPLPLERQVWSGTKKAISEALRSGRQYGRFERRDGRWYFIGPGSQGE